MFTKFTSSDFTNKDVTSMPDRPSNDGWTAAQIKARLDNVGKVMIALGKYNELIDELTASSAAAQIGATEGNVQSTLNNKVNKASVLTKDNTTQYVPTSQYHPATKGYADSLSLQAGSVASVYGRAGHVIAQAGDYAASDISLANPIFPNDANVEEALTRLSNAFSQIFVAGAGAHNSIFRGKFLGNAVTTEQYAAISSGEFTDLYIGDYWTIGGVNYRIAAFDYYYRTGDTELTTHHAVIVPGTALYAATMNATDTTTGGYVGSLMYTANLAQAKTIINAAFSGHVMQHRQLLTNSVTNGKASAGAWFDSTVELMNERMVYGTGAFSPVSDGTVVPMNSAISKSQLPLFAMRPDLISNRNTYWLRDVVSATSFASVHNYGSASSGNASYSPGVRPAFSIF